jgi:hypothetical protein
MINKLKHLSFYFFRMVNGVSFNSHNSLGFDIFLFADAKFSKVYLQGAQK